jgi:hypothetical protein
MIIILNHFFSKWKKVERKKESLMIDKISSKNYNKNMTDKNFLFLQSIYSVTSLPEELEGKRGIWKKESGQ